MGRRHHHSEEEKAAEQQHHSVSSSVASLFSSSHPSLLYLLEYLENGMVVRRLLGGPGSSPPRCTWKCGKCTPCKPVHVSVPPGTPVTAEYYPEAWRCKCGNKLYMP
ncbi:EPIDERMAL PATTERNING FACTOR-like protein 6 [Linum grandiflorum]